MNFESYPIAYQSAFRPALFVLADVEAPNGLDVEVLPAASSNVLGVKRIYGTGQFAVNASPYISSLLAPEPLCSESMGLVFGPRRYAGCRVKAAGNTSPVAYLTAGIDNAPVGSILSAAPTTLTIRPCEKDEISVITGGGSVTPTITFFHNGSEYTDDIFLSDFGAGVLTFVVDQAAVAQKFSSRTGLDGQDMREFTVVLRLTLQGGQYAYVRRKYIVDTTPHRGHRLAWINRYGAIDYYTFPDTTLRTLSGGRGRIISATGWSAISTETEDWTLLTSDYEQGSTLEWLAEILSSPRVWIIERDVATEIDVADGAVSFDPTLPGNLTVRVRPSAVSISRQR
jgi:hypothetical protein